MCQKFLRTEPAANPAPVKIKRLAVNELVPAAYLLLAIRLPQFLSRSYTGVRFATEREDEIKWLGKRGTW